MKLVGSGPAGGVIWVGIAVLIIGLATGLELLVLAGLLTAVIAAYWSFG